ncbi:hypothetical protein LEP1GSC161_1099 [Leptospira santarosai str. CBC1416]|uniref:Uncharacterized protein n=1 Tax=Leptospira santarosai str. CBC1416 TaxID=1193059 RepID=M6W4M5_9LEPT|nr:hypothetical protein LEP1GSC165_3747 [Leptospira santarosai str. CBC523]EMO60154.1 hypothetical protein LEP1GSC161_1099 [Leptospira santarosai str. CBC1416]EMO86213.1 hypothetical protein LEP1GSC070_2912 [Leptospira santarosai str. AIM]
MSVKVKMGKGLYGKHLCKIVGTPSILRKVRFKPEISFDYG